MIHTLVLLLCCFIFNDAHARPSVTVNHANFLDIETLCEVSTVHHVPLWALLGILATEKGKIGQAVQNHNKTWDMGPFQINTIHINNLLAKGLAPTSILSDAKVNANIAAWLLAGHLSETNDIWQAIGNYHSRNPRYNHTYIQKVFQNVMYLQDTQNSIDNLLAYVNDVR